MAGGLGGDCVRRGGGCFGRRGLSFAKLMMSGVVEFPRSSRAANPVLAHPEPVEG